MDDYMDARLFCLELLRSIREYEARIDELIIMLDCQDGFIENERRFSALARLEGLISTRELLIDSFHKVSDRSKAEANGRETSNPFDQITAKYADLRVEAKRLLEEYEERKKCKHQRINVAHTSRGSSLD